MGLSISSLFISYIPPTQLIGKAIVITGCDTGFGHDLSLRLVARGMIVYAGCLTVEGTCKSVELEALFG